MSALSGESKSRREVALENILIDAIERAGTKQPRDGGACNCPACLYLRGVALSLSVQQANR